ncbi:MAG TPA: thioredoxin fold domain-containing protein [Candidatus Kryptonia bacterium]
MNAVKESGGDLRWTNYTEGIRQAAESHKKILIDVYTDWCGWCKKMESDTYSDQGVKDYLLSNYVLVKLNAESDAKETVDSQQVTQAQIAGAFGVDGYPTTIFLDSNGHPITMAPGYMKPDTFIGVLKYIAEDAYKKMGYKEYLDSQGVHAK